MSKNSNIFENQHQIVFFKHGTIKSKYKNRDDFYEYVSNCNSKGYRSDEFKKDHNSNHILFSGCSETFGAGDIMENSWAHMTYTAISKNIECSGFFNLGKSGAGFKEIIYGIYKYIDEFKAPDSIFVLFPNVARTIVYLDHFGDPELRGYYSVFPDLSNDLIVTHKNNVEPDSILVDTGGRKAHRNLDKDEFANFMLAVKGLEAYCNALGIRLFWSTWDTKDLKWYTEAYSKMVKNYVCIDIDNQDLYKKTLEGLNLEKPDGHHGTAYHSLWSDNFVNAYNY